MKSGIYQIKNTLNGKVYVGSAKDFEKRWKRHFKDLENGVHSSIKFQRSFNKHGNVFECSVLEEIPYEKDLIIERENFWIKELNSKINGYNIADASFGDVLSNHPLKEEIAKKRAETVKAKLENVNARLKESEKEYLLQLSVGIFVSDSKIDDRKVFELADDALYLAKNSDNSKISIYKEQ